MSTDDFELLHGSGNVFRDFGFVDAEVRQTKSILAAEILKALDERGWSTRKAEGETSVDHADFTRIRRMKIDRFSIERLATILGALGQDVELSVKVTPRKEASMHALQSSPA